MENNWSIDELQEIWNLASKIHNGQKYGGQNKDEQIEYINHIGSVTFEILFAVNLNQIKNPSLAIKCAILHDSIEDTKQSYIEISDKFGKDVADGVLALTKNEQLKNKDKMMLDSLERIAQQPKEVWAVKMADRISNLYAPPFYWTNEKKINYIKEAKLIYSKLKEGNSYLANRLKLKIDEYSKYIN